MEKVAFRRSIRSPGGARINVSGRSVGASMGVRGARISQRADGRTTLTTSLPGTGLSRTDALRNPNAQRTVSVGRSQAALAPAGSVGYWMGFILNCLFPGLGIGVIGKWGWAALWFVAVLVAANVAPLALLVVWVGSLFHYRALYAPRFPA